MSQIALGGLLGFLTGCVGLVIFEIVTRSRR